VAHNLLRNTDTLSEIHLLERPGQKEPLRDLHLLLGVVALQLNDHEAVEKDLVDLADVIGAEHEHGLAEIQRDPGEILVLEVAVLRRVGEMHEEVLDLLALGRGTDLVQLVEHEHHRHRLGGH